ncbi:hypothetical protein AUEXF2481DRAFT_28231 [Aureobasidium subglaciale EXF-2481]|uniref:NAD-dependent epimerase/dehydratase domain-containing protein n=1 Tax=Aureobasidium subglaciale (strain EXF-2481) TaxID=1043005 RepID=A0A074YH68_AURSE|nr:uncharacterized protein AUEXF2481DRAFT_28231 [Aureobasidium subglaciale EXF-2481]KAI5200064.1 hypothetical protein E4T38_06689 [Aureobasidium subglaciale]KAI5222494.1 hypothetical protein E4T41_06540 [Aureobasidium subglaciale]KAI5223290.1 hypothetical protein E4T40_04457 [Aureobasidium subglaciale]KAI5246514.1 hypothetical protein E4T43_02561 [Aureobasidium subglaciale]KAI5259888.1 hypothetical protein E4T46_06427 [Aureobasidium subglaciale]
MKIIVTGCTGVVGSEVLRSAIKHQFITHIYAITRQPLDPKIEDHPKVTQIIHEDFEQWPDHLMRLFEHEGVRGCIWCIGGWVAKFPSLEEAQRVNIALPQSAAEAFSSALSPSSAEISQTRNKRGIPFRFIYMSCNGAEQNPFASLWWSADSRKMKGAAEKGLFELADSRNPGSFEVYSLRLGKVLPGGQTVYNLMTMGSTTSIADNLVAKCALNIVIDGRMKDEGGRILENVDCLGDDWSQINSLSID